MPLLPEVIKKYVSHTFVETGTYEGEAVDRALKAGFEVIHSMDVDADKIKGAKKRFKAFSNIYIYHGTSVETLPKILALLRGPATFWLDAHGSSMLDVVNCPVASELAAIQAALPDITVRAVLIDDMRLFSPADRLWLENRLKEIFPAATILKECGIQGDDVLVASL